MVMSLPIQMPSRASPASSDDSSNLPRTPNSPSIHSLPLSDGAAPNMSPQQVNQNIGNTQAKRKPSRRANTAERRATHNAVERQRRETLNGRFLDLAALLPNLSQIRRPSKSSIVNSSIAHVHASRRHRALAARELRTLKAECDSLRHELNEWRDRAGVPRVEEPIRGDGFSMIISGEMEVLNSVPDDDEDMTTHQFDGFDEPEEDFAPSFGHSNDELDDSRIPMAQNLSMLKNGAFAHPLASAPHDNGASQQIAHFRRHSMHQHQSPIIVANPQTVSFENPAMASLFETHVHPYGAGHFLAQQTLESDKVATWGAQVYAQQQHQVIRPQYNPSTRTTAPDTTAAIVDHALFANLQRPQQLTSLPLHTNSFYGTDNDDSSSVGSGRERSRSISGGSGFGSPLHHESPVSYEVSGAQIDYGIPRKMSSAELGLATNMWTQNADGMVGMGMMKQGLGSPISVGGGGNGTGFGMMM